jgi:hypothetical protein
MGRVVSLICAVIPLFVLTAPSCAKGVNVNRHYRTLDPFTFAYSFLRNIRQHFVLLSYRIVWQDGAVAGVRLQAGGLNQSSLV